jgi:dihydrofolate reductase
LELIIIAAMAANRVIGCNNTIPWHIAEDMAHFQRTTMGHTLIMGRRTYESLPGPLAGRRNIVLSTNPGFRPHPDCEKATSLDEALSLCQGTEKVFIIGGAQLYREALPLAHTLILTVIGRVFAGDIFFPDFSDQPWQLINSREIAADVPLTIMTYTRTAAPAVFRGILST